MKTKIILIASLLSIVGYILPLVITKAGTNPSPNVELPGPPSVLTMRITAYASVPEQTDDTPFITANGTMVRDGIVATNLLPFGTQIMIPEIYGKKVFIVEDRMAPVFKKTIDIWMPSVGKAARFGVKFAKVVIIPPGPNFVNATTSVAQTTLAATEDKNTRL